MAAFASTDVTVALAQRDIIPLGMSKKMTFPSITFGNGAITYHATTKVPMPAIGNFGFKKAIERVFIEQPANGYIYHYDRTNSRIRIFLGAARDAITVANHVGVAPTGNVAAPANHSNIAVSAPANHSHDLFLAGNAVGASDVDVGANTSNSALVGNVANAVTIPGANSAANGGVLAAAVAAPANIANLTHNAPAFTGDVMANLTHTVTGGSLVAEAALAEMDTGVAPAAVTLYTQMIGQ